MPALLGLLLAASIDGGAALRHASALAALGPHPWGSTRNEAAARYVAAELRAAGLAQVELQPFERHGVRGTNVIATLPARADEVVLFAAHHDTARDSPGAYDAAGGIGVLLELARGLAQEGPRTRTLVFASFDGGEAWLTGLDENPGSRAYLDGLGPRARDVVAAVALEMAGWERGTPAVHPIAYADPRRPGESVIAPGWLVAAALSGSAAGGEALRVGDPWLSWLVQPAARAFRVRLHGDDRSFVQAGRPAILLSDSSFSAVHPDEHKPNDTADRLSAAALERMGHAALGVASALDRVSPGPASDPHWFAVLGTVIGWPWLAGLAAASLLPGLRVGLAAGGLPLVLRVVQAVLFGVVFWYDPVVALFVLLLPQLVWPWRRGWPAVCVALLPLAALLAFGVAAWWRGLVNGVWLAPWRLALLAFALALAFVGLQGGRPRAGRSGPRPGGRGPGRPPGSPKRRR